MRNFVFFTIFIMCFFSANSRDVLDFPNLSGNSIKNTKNRLLSGDDIFYGIYYYGGINFNKKIYWKSLNNFFSYYNEINKNNLIKPLGDDFYFKNNFSHGFEFFIMSMTLGVTFSKLKGSTNSILLNGDQRVIDVDLNTYTYNFDIVIPIAGFFGFGLVWGYTQYKGEFSSGYKYKFNEYISYAEDRYFNGIYSVFSTGNFNIGGRFNINLKYVNIVFELQKYVYLYMDKVSEEQTLQLLPLHDKLHSTQTGQGIYSDGYFRKEFPFAPDPETGYNNLYKYPQGWHFTVKIGVGISNVHD